jgi:hypothetical protein
LDLRSFKLHFIDGTDVFIRSRKAAHKNHIGAAAAAAEKRAERRLARFRRWVDKKRSELAPMPEDANASALLGSMMSYEGEAGEDDGADVGEGGEGDAAQDGEAEDSGVAEALMAAGMEAAGMDEEGGDPMEQDQEEDEDSDDKQENA